MTAKPSPSLQEAFERALRLARQTGSIAKVGGWEIDLIANAVHWSNETYALHEVSEETFIPTPESTQAFFTDEDRPRIIAAFRRLVEGSERLDIECEMITAKARRIWVRVIGEVRFESDHPVRIYGTIQDISETKGVETDLRRNFEQLKSFIEHLPAGVALLDDDLRIITASLSWAEIFDLDDSELTGELLSDIMPPLGGTWRTALAVALEGGAHGPFEDSFRASDNRLRWLRLEVRPWFEEGHVAGLLLGAEDITAARESRRRDEQLMQAISNSSMVTITDIESRRITYVNDYLLAVSGYRRDEVIGATHHSLFNSNYHDPMLFEELWRTVMAGRPWRGELRHRKKNGEFFWISVTASPMADETGQIREVLAIEFDITDRVQSEARLVQAAKMSALGEMAGGIAHEINNPLSILLGRASQLRRETSGGAMSIDRMRVAVERIERTAERIARIVKGLRNFAREDVTDPFVETTVNSIVSDTLELCEQRIRTHMIELTIRLPEVPLYLECRPTQIMQVLLNLLGNAVDAVTDQEQREIELKVERDGDHMIISVTDSGPGIHPAVSDRLFQPFFTTKEIGHGTGLGLSISRGIVIAHRGEIDLDAESPNTCFRVKLPLRQPRTALQNDH